MSGRAGNVDQFGDVDIPESPMPRQAESDHFPQRRSRARQAPSPISGPHQPEGEPMPAVQSLLPFARPLATRVRSVRRPFHPGSRDPVSYRLPHDIRDRLAASLAPFRNREAAFALAVFLARFWSVPGRVSGSFPIDRRALTDHQDLQLTEARVRGAIKTLEAVGFLERALASGSPYKPTADGLRRKPILFAFGAEYAPLFIAANTRAVAAHGGGTRDRRPVPGEISRRPSTASAEARPLNSPKGRSEADKSVLMGDVRQTIGLPPQASQSDANLDAALERLRRAIGKAGGGSGA
jgi:hypothetical protein